MPGAAPGDGAGRRFTNQNEVDGALVRRPPEVVLLALLRWSIAASGRLMK
jgi:hypothetical protein